MKFSVYADGSSSGNSTGPGGWGWVVVIDGSQILCSGSGGVEQSTNNIMELMAAREGLRALVSHPTFLSSQNPSVELVSDSQYVLGLASGSYSPTKNVVLAEHVRDVCKKYNVKTRWVRGHAGDTLNMICDKLAKHGKDEMTPNKVLRRRAEKKAKQEAKKSRKRKKNDSSN